MPIRYIIIYLCTVENLEKVISLHQASKISGYHQDYLSALIRKKDIKGEKLGGNWFTTEEEIKKYIFKQKTRNKKWIIKYFLYFKKFNKSLIYTFICLALLSASLYFYNKKNYSEIKAEAINTKFSDIDKPETKEESKELKF
ncbi:MAG: hypothetical protein UT09_C0039G0007 [Parcubacteria group bacterium GW2011_GWF2_38_8]|nr:MAG: hypothetical protein UT09_C0039G0007 [Parcubacteria group bacterium GW2011_GWF2_38_8]